MEVLQKKPEICHITCVLKKREYESGGKCDTNSYQSICVNSNLGKTFC